MNSLWGISARWWRLWVASLFSCVLVACAGGETGTGLLIRPSETLPGMDTSAVPQQDPGSKLTARWADGPFMEIYVRGYQDSDGDGIGDLPGLIQRLDYLKELGITGLWLMPVTQSQDHDHGYAVADYRNIETDYGNLADLDELLKQAHARGIGVIIDYVINHSATRHPAFVNSSAATNNAFRDWYVWQDSKPGGWSIYDGDPWRRAATGWYYAPFSEQMPDFNLRHPATVAWHQDNLRFWLNRGLDGVRVDAVGNLVENGPAAWENQPENYPLMGEMRQLLAGYANRYMVCEGPVDPFGYAAASACGSAFAFGHNYAIVKAVRGDANALKAVAGYPSTAPAGMATMVSNHDSFAGRRLWNQVGGNLAQYRLAAATYLLQPGIPFIYYGEEIGMADAASLGGDPGLRTPMSWTADAVRAGFTRGTPFRALSANVGTQNAAAQQADPNSLYAFYKAMLGLRHARPSLARGSYDGAVVDGGVLSFRRSLGSEQTLAILNMGAAVALNLTGLTPGAHYQSLWPAGGSGFVADGSGKASLNLGAQAVMVFGRLL